MAQVIHEMSSKKLGMTTVLTAGKALAGIVSDGDLRRLLERVGPQAVERTAGDLMNRAPQTVSPNALASEALAQMEERKITSLVVVQGGVVEGGGALARSLVAGAAVNQVLRPHSSPRAR